MKKIQITFLTLIMGMAACSPISLTKNEIISRDKLREETTKEIEKNPALKEKIKNDILYVLLYEDPAQTAHANALKNDFRLIKSNPPVLVNGIIAPVIKTENTEFIAVSCKKPVPMNGIRDGGEWGHPPLILKLVAQYNLELIKQSNFPYKAECHPSKEDVDGIGKLQDIYERDGY